MDDRVCDRRLSSDWRVDVEQGDGTHPVLFQKAPIVRRPVETTPVRPGFADVVDPSPEVPVPFQKLPDLPVC